LGFLGGVVDLLSFFTVWWFADFSSNACWEENEALDLAGGFIRE